MKNIKDALPPFGRDFEPSEEKQTITDRFRNAGVAVILGIVFVHVFYFGSAIFVRVAIGEIFSFFKEPVFLSFLAICAVFGWFRGLKFTRWLHEEISCLKFW